MNQRPAGWRLPARNELFEVRPRRTCMTTLIDQSGVMPHTLSLSAIASYNPVQIKTNFDRRTAVTGEEAWSLANHWVAA